MQPWNWDEHRTSDTQNPLIRIYSQNIGGLGESITNDATYQSAMADLYTLQQTGASIIALQETKLNDHNQRTKTILNTIRKKIWNGKTGLFMVPTRRKARPLVISIMSPSIAST